MAGTSHLKTQVLDFIPNNSPAAVYGWDIGRGSWLRVIWKHC